MGILGIVKSTKTIESALNPEMVNELKGMYEDYPLLYLTGLSYCLKLEWDINDLLNLLPKSKKYMELSKEQSAIKKMIEYRNEMRKKIEYCLPLLEEKIESDLVLQANIMYNFNINEDNVINYTLTLKKLYKLQTKIKKLEEGVDKDYLRIVQKNLKFEKIKNIFKYLNKHIELLNQVKSI